MTCQCPRQWSGYHLETCSNHVGTVSELQEILDSRQNEYGDAETNFTKIGILWGELLEREPIPAYQVALLMDVLKTVRLFQNSTHADSWFDKGGYTTHGQSIAMKGSQ